MQLKTKNLKYIINNALTFTFVALFSLNSVAQDETLVIDEASNIETQKEISIADTLKEKQRFKVDGVIGVVGEYIVLESDIDRTYLQLQQQSVSTQDISRCELFGKLLEDKLYAHHAVQDSIVVSETEINGRLDQQIEYMTAQLGSEEKVYQFYNKNSMAELRRELFEINKAMQLATMMREKIYEDVEVTPEEVRQFFQSIPEDERPVFGTELEVAQIVIEPEITEQARQDVIDRLNEFRRDVVENGASFTTKAVLYSQDEGSATKGGFYTINKKTQFAKEFKDVAFSLQEGEVSEPFETEFGFHIVMVEKVRGQDLDVRHILLFPEVSEETIQKARAKIDNIREKIINDEITFSEAARTESDETETKNNGGQLINPTTGDTRFDLTKMDPALSAQIYNLKEDEVSPVYVDEDRTGRKSFKILTVTNRYEEHVADFSKDYEKIKELALTKKRIDAIEKWQTNRIRDTYISISNDYNDCNFANNWLQQ